MRLLKSFINMKKYNYSYEKSALYTHYSYEKSAY